MKTTVAIYKCDGEQCGATLHPGAGVVIVGTVRRVDGNTTSAALVGDHPEDETALCWDCLRKRLGSPDRVVEKRVEVERSYHDDYSRPGNGPTGPLSPPELPHYVGIVANLTRACTRSVRSTPVPQRSGTPER